MPLEGGFACGLDAGPARTRERLFRRFPGTAHPVRGAFLAASICLATVSGFVAASPSQAQEEARVVKRLPQGEGGNSVGVVPGREDIEAVGPSAIYADDKGGVYLLDQVNGRILSMNVDNPSAPPETLHLPPGLEPTDMVAMKDMLYVWDGKVHALQGGATDNPAAVGPAPGTSSTLEARSISDPDDLTRSAFAQMGSQTPSSDEEVIGAVGRSLTPQDFEAPIKQTVASRTLGQVSVVVLPGRNGKSAVVEARPLKDPLSLYRFEVNVSDRLGSLEVLDIDTSGNTFVFTENIPPKPGARASIFVARYTRAGRLDRIYDLPITADQIGSRRFVTISAGGKVLFLKSDATGVSIVELASRRAKRQLLDPPPLKVAGSAMEYADPGIITAVRPNSRLGVIQMGLGFEGLKWQVSPQSYGKDPDMRCTGFDGRVRRPGYLDGQVGQEVRGVPYCWGCFGTLIQFKRKVDAGALAGNWCTRDDPRTDVVGVDCSSFVSATWGLSRHYTTAEIPRITKPLDNPWDLKPGDALNKAGSHVMLFVKFTPDRKVEVLEASTGGCNGRVCRNVYPLSVLLARGYQPVRYPLLTD
ncbi:hypothetical protein MWN34_03325 [Ancylobacter sp. 6x-1]|uniref:Peptidoglycan endopeptidase n=1 Tax=Ancylobacter crimeensis TaxID=2579147 RepID=A0ABT0D7K9_9HYPH|nr:hypothetical protein [Ancylobacter crimeensis]MCK0195936.1 hypothetical protein [Ancylobacter crimeensis]